RARAAEEPLARQTLEQDRPEREDVPAGRGGGGLTAVHLRRHVARGAGPRGVGGGAQAVHAEVGDAGRAGGGTEDVVRAQVAVVEAEAVRGLEGGAQRGEQ